MCGRTACTLAPDCIQKACSYNDKKTGKHKKPEWREHPTKTPNSPTNFNYYPSANMCPTQFTPVLFSPSKSEDGDPDLTLQPMLWSMIPPWHKGDMKSHGMSTNNCRLEGLLESKLFMGPLKERRLCVIVANGFYEWKTVKASKNTPKQPYLIFMSQDNNNYSPEDISKEDTWESASWDEEEGWKGPKILMMAGLYSVWKSPEGESIYSYSIITMESNSTLSWLHHRMPAILDTPEQVQAWLNPKPDASIEEIISILKPTTSLQWYTVSTKVNNARCHDLDCHKKSEVQEKAQATFMSNWLKKTSKVKAEEDPAEDNVETKKPKLEPQ